MNASMWTAKMIGLFATCLLSPRSYTRARRNITSTYRKDRMCFHEGNESSTCPMRRALCSMESGIEPMEDALPDIYARLTALSAASKTHPTCQSHSMHARTRARTHSHTHTYIRAHVRRLHDNKWNKALFPLGGRSYRSLWGGCILCIQVRLSSSSSSSASSSSSSSSMIHHHHHYYYNHDHFLNGNTYHYCYCYYLYYYYYYHYYYYSVK